MCGVCERRNVLYVVVYLRLFESKRKKKKEKKERRNGVCV